jgi:phenylalanine-4-hydroxylase
MVQTNFTEYDEVERQIERSKIFRFPYKEMLKESMTAFITSAKARGLDFRETMRLFYEQDGVQQYIITNPHLKDRLDKNVYTTICARFAEQKSFMRRS